MILFRGLTEGIEMSRGSIEMNKRMKNIIHSPISTQRKVIGLSHSTSAIRATMEPDQPIDKDPNRF